MSVRLSGLLPSGFNPLDDIRETISHIGVVVVSGHPK
jgi:hypothetical protein